MNECPISKYMSDTGLLVLRLSLSVVMWPHGAQKVLGWFGGGGYDATYLAFTQGMGIWGPMAFVAIMTEFFAPLFLVVGLLSRLAALFLTIQMCVIASMLWNNGFFMNWYNTPGKGEGIEYSILFLGISIALILLGPGKYSLDRIIATKILSSGKMPCCK